MTRAKELIEGLLVEAEKPLVWSVGWRKIWDQIQATYNISEKDGKWSASEGGRGYSQGSKQGAIDWALEDFMKKLRQVAK